MVLAIDGPGRFGHSIRPLADGRFGRLVMFVDLVEVDEDAHRGRARGARRLEACSRPPWPIMTSRPCSMLKVVDAATRPGSCLCGWARRAVDEGVRSCPRAGCRKSARLVVCPAKAGMFSRRKACRGKSQKPRSLDSRVAGNQDSEAYRQRLPREDDESPGRNDSERENGLESA